MKKVFVVLAMVAVVAVCATSCGKGCTCKMKADVTGMMPVFEDESMSKSDCTAKEAELNEEYGMDVITCK